MACLELISTLYKLWKDCYEYVKFRSSLWIMAFMDDLETILLKSEDLGLLGIQIFDTSLYI
jgi:hypothetical protein